MKMINGSLPTIRQNEYNKIITLDTPNRNTQLDITPGKVYYNIHLKGDPR